MCKGHKPLGCSGTGSFPRGRLWDLWREPDGLPGLQGHQVMKIKMMVMANKDTRPPGSVCGQEKPMGRGSRGTSSFGTDARLFDFPQMITTQWEVGSSQEVVWESRGSHKGGYTYRWR